MNTRSRPYLIWLSICCLAASGCQSRLREQSGTSASNGDQSLATSLDGLEKALAADTLPPETLNMIIQVAESSYPSQLIGTAPEYAKPAAASFRPRPMAAPSQPPTPRPTLDEIAKWDKLSTEILPRIAIQFKEIESRYRQLNIPFSSKWLDWYASFEKDKNTEKIPKNILNDLTATMIKMGCAELNRLDRALPRR